MSFILTEFTLTLSKTESDVSQFWKILYIHEGKTEIELKIEGVFLRRFSVLSLPPSQWNLLRRSFLTPRQVSNFLHALSHARSFAECWNCVREETSFIDFQMFAVYRSAHCMVRSLQLAFYGKEFQEDSRPNLRCRCVINTIPLSIAIKRTHTNSVSYTHLTLPTILLV